MGREYSSLDELPAAARQAYERAMSALADADRNGVPDVLEAAGPEAQARDDPVRKLKKLLDDGLITKQEYEAKRAQILAEM